jgi:hypothetical protein
MTRLTALLAGAALVVFGSPAIAQLTPQEARNLEAILSDPAKLNQVRARLGIGKPVALRGRASAAQRPPAEPTTLTAVEVPPKIVSPLNKHTPAVQDSGRRRAKVLLAAPDVAPEELSPCAGFKLLLRQDWKDIGLLACPEATADADGAEISYSHDRVSNNSVWNLQGTAGVFYSSLLDAPGAYYKSFGVYVTANRVFNSNAAFVKGDSDKMVFGGAGEIGIQTATLGTHYFRLRGGAVEDRLKSTSSVNITGEWIPVYDDGNIHINSPFRPFNRTAPFILEFIPTVLAQYAAVAGANQTLDFNDRAHALRIGPQVTVRVSPLPGIDGPFSRMHATVNYHWAYETYSGKGISWFDTAIVYNIDDDGHFALKASYKKGRDEDTGTLTDIYKIALTGKI